MVNKNSRRARFATAALGIGLLAGVAAPLPAVADAPAGLEDIPWDANYGLLNPWFDHVTVKADRLEDLHPGMPLPEIRYPSGTPKAGYPYFFFGLQEDGSYLSEFLLMCIDIFHDDYDVPEDSTYIDLTHAVPEATAREIHYTINAGLELAASRGLVIRTDGSLPLEFTTEESAAIMMATQIKTWQLYSRDYLAKPMPHIELDDFEARRPDATQVDLTAEYAELDARVGQYRQAPAFVNEAHELSDTLTLQDPNLSGFRIALDAENSTPGFEEHVDVTINDDNSILLTRLSDSDEPVELAFVKTFNHSAGGHQAGAAIRAEGRQAKAVVGTFFTERFTVTVNTPIVVVPPVEEEEPPTPVVPPVEEEEPPTPVVPPVEEEEPPTPIIPPVEEEEPPTPIIPPVEEEEPKDPTPIIPPVEEEGPKDPILIAPPVNVDTPLAPQPTPIMDPEVAQPSLAETGGTVPLGLLGLAAALGTVGVILFAAKQLKRRSQA